MVQHTENDGESISVPPITVKGFSEDAAHTLANPLGIAYAYLVKTFNIDVSNLTNIIIAKDYFDELASIDKGTGNQPTATREEHATGIAQVVPFIKDGTLTMRIVIDASLCGYFLDENEENLTMGIHLLHHELMHVHDSNMKVHMFPDVWAKTRLEGRSGYLFQLAEGMWSEYHANRNSSITAPKQSIQNAFILLRDSYKNVPKKIRDAIIDYRTQRDLDTLLRTVIRLVDVLLCSAAYVQGYCSGLASTAGELDPDIWAEIEKSKFIRHWKPMRDAFDSMHDRYPNWESLVEYKNLEDIAEAVINEFGLFFHDTQNGLWVDVPFTPETTPNVD